MACLGTWAIDGFKGRNALSRRLQIILEARSDPQTGRSLEMDSSHPQTTSLQDSNPTPQPLTNILAQKDKEDLEELSTELELADEDDLVACVLPLSPPFQLPSHTTDQNPKLQNRRLLHARPSLRGPGPAHGTDLGDRRRGLGTAGGAGRDQGGDLRVEGASLCAVWEGD